MRFTPIPAQTFDSVGKPLCRWCSGSIPSGRRRTFCSDNCVHEARIRSDGSYIRECIKKRDGGICADCGLDTERFRLDFSYLLVLRSSGINRYDRTRRKVKKKYPNFRFDHFHYFISQSEMDRRIAAGPEFRGPYHVPTTEDEKVLCLHRRLKKLAGARIARLIREMPEFKEFFSGHRTSLYDADHIVPVEQGGSNDLTNIATRCLRCHKLKSRLHAAERARKKRGCTSGGS